VRVCCLADIPIAHLAYHAERYGKIAIGFHRAAAVRGGFNPVFYSLQRSDALFSLYESFARLQKLDTEQSWSLLERAASDIEDLKCSDGHAVDQDDASDIQYEIEEADGLIAEANNKLKRFLAFVKTFNDDEFSTIYTEREWRSTDAFSFTLSDIAMVVLPKQAEDRTLFQDFFSEQAGREMLGARVPVVPWEDLLEH
jgi:hypothetical protein